MPNKIPQNISSSTKFSVISGWLASLDGIWKVSDLISAIKQISNSPDIDGIEEIGKIFKWEKQSEEGLSNTISIDELYVDFDYQRIFYLRKAVKRISSEHGNKFEVSACGAIDVAVRPDGRTFVWDGLHRTILAGLAGFDKIQHSKYSHSLRLSDNQCKEAEARFFKLRNADSSPMAPEEVWKAKVMYGDKEALRLKALFAKCSLDVLGVVDRRLTTKLGGFKEIENQYGRGKDLKDEHLQESSRILRKVFRDPNSLSVFLWCGLAYFLKVNDEIQVPDTYSNVEIEEKIEEVVHKYRWKQSSFIKPRLSGKTCESVAYRIAKDVIGDTNGLLIELSKELSADDLAMFEDQTKANLDSDVIDTDEDM